MHQGVGFVKLGANRNSKKKSLMEGLGGGGGGWGGMRVITDGVLIVG